MPNHNYKVILRQFSRRSPGGTYTIAVALLSITVLLTLLPFEAQSQAKEPLPVANQYGDSLADPVQNSSGDPGKFDPNFYEVVQRLVENETQAGSQRGFTYHDIIVVVNKYDGNGTDVSGQNKDAVVEILRLAGAQNIHAPESLSFVTASVPVGSILEVSEHGQVYRVGDGESPATPAIDTLRATIGATVDDLRRQNGVVTNGSGVAVGVLDYGVNHPLGINDKVVSRILCFGGCAAASAGSVTGPDPENLKATHGTQVALVIAGSGFSKHNGIAPGVDIMDAGIGSHRTGTNSAAISNGLAWLLNEGADVSNLSFGDGACHKSKPDTTRQLMTGEAVDNGMVVVISAGNEGKRGTGQDQAPVYKSINEWGCSHNVITVGGIDDRNPDNIRMYTSSSRGPASHNVNGTTYPVLKPEIVAPSYNLQIPQYVANGATGPTSGTSFSTPAVSAAAATVLQEREMTPAAVKAAILLGANWTGPVPCTSVQYEQDDAADNCSHKRQPRDFAEANYGGSLEIINNVGFGILDVGKTLDYVTGASGSHLVEDSLHSDAGIDTYRFEVADTGDPVKVILSWTADPFYDEHNSPLGEIYFSDLGFTVDCPGMDTISAQSAYQANEFAVFVPAEAGTCTVVVTGSGVDTPQRSQQDYALASTIPLTAFDIERPEPTILTAEPSPTNAHSIDFTVDFGESIDTGTFTSSDISASGGTVVLFTGHGSTARAFTFTVSNLGAGNLTVAIPEGGILDLAGNNNTASDLHVIEIDQTRPASVLSASESLPTDARKITFTVDFDESMDTGTFTSSDISASGGTVSDPRPVNSTARAFTFTVSNLGAGNLTVAIPEGRILDLAGNNNTASNQMTLAITGVPAGTTPDDAFITTWKTTRANESITITTGGTRGTYTIDWGDARMSTGVSGDQTHVYNTPGTYTISIYGDLAKIYLPDYLTNAEKLQSIEQWGSIPWKSMNGAFAGATNMEYRATDAPDLSTVTDMSEMFWFASSFDGDLSNWDVSSVTDMSRMFFDAVSFNGDISSWNVSSVTDMSDMFRAAIDFNQNLGIWYIVLDDTTISNANETLSISAQNAYLDGQNPTYAVDDARFVISDGSLAVNPARVPPNGTYDVTITTDGIIGETRGTTHSRTVKVTVGGDTAPPTFVSTTYSMGNGTLTLTFNELLNGLVHYDRLHIRDAGQTSDGIHLDDTHLRDSSGSVVTVTLTAQQQADFVRMAAPQLDIDLGAVSDAHGNEIGAVTDRLIDTVGVVADSGAFTTTWTVGAGDSITIPVGGSATAYDIDWGDGTVDVDSTGDQTHTYDAAGNYTVRIWGGFERIYLNGDAGNAPKMASIDSWGDTQWTSMESAFAGASNMAYLATDTPDLSGVTDASNMFRGASSFNGNITGWDVSSVTDMAGMFEDAASFNQPLSSWDVSSVTNMTNMFEDAASFNQSLDSWDVSSVTDMADMFAYGPFNQSLDSWDVSSVTNMASMFEGAASFNQPLSSWDVSSVADMNSMFLDANDFNQNLGDWNVSSVTDMADMFFYAISFDQNLGIWYIVLDDTTISNANETLAISAQNPFLDGQNPTYAIDDARFVVVDGTLAVNSTQVPPADTYNVTITSTGGFGTGNSRVVEIITGIAQANNPPVVEAGPDKLVHEGDMVILAGNATDRDGDLLAYSWNQTSGLPTIDLPGANMSSLTFTAPAVPSDTRLVFEITVSDGLDAATDTVAITVRDKPGSAYFVTTWKTAAAGQSITIPVGGATGTYAINWGDGTTSAGVSGDQTHVYDAAGTYTVRISGDFVRMHLDGKQPDANRLQSIEQWGDTRWESMNSAFRGASNVAYRATDVPDLSRVTDMSNMLYQASAFNGDLSGWDVSSVTDMSSMFHAADAFNGNLSSWDVSGVTSMSHMFTIASAFNGDLSGWDVSSVTDMSSMFTNAGAFNGDLSGWDVSSVTNMIGMFHATDAFNGDLSGWDVSSVTNMNNMFHAADAFNGDLSGWDVSSVTDMSNMFYQASSFNADLSGWDVSSVTNMNSMFHAADAFNGDLSGWDVSSVTDMSNMFYQASSFNGDLSGWDVSSVTNMNSMLYRASSFNGDLSGWDVSSVTNMNSMLYRASSFNGDLSGWDVSAVTDMFAMFARASSFNGDLSGWDVSAVTDMNSMFYQASSFNGDLSGWDVSSVTDMSNMFYQASSFDQNLGDWYIVLDDDAISHANQTLAISAQNAYLDSLNPNYGVDETTGSGYLFAILDGALTIKSGQSIPPGTYNVTLTSDSVMGEADDTGHSRTVGVTVDLGYALTESSIVASPITFVADEEDGFEELEGPKGIATVAIGSSTYALAAAYDDDGFQIINITDPYDPRPVAAATDGEGGFERLGGARYVTTVAIDSSTYALVTASAEGGIQIINITAPPNPVPVAHISNVSGSALSDARGIATTVIGSSTYAVVATNGCIIHMIDITDPSNPNPTATVTDGCGGLVELNGARGVATTVIDSSTYALVAAHADNAVQIINITDPSSPIHVTAVHDSQDSMLHGATAVTATTIGSSTYALVAAQYDNAVQIINITDPSSPDLVAFAQDGRDGFDRLEYPEGIAVVTFGSSTYAVVAAFLDGIQIIDITDPSNPTPAASVGSFGDGFNGEDVAFATIDSRTYAIIASTTGNGVSIIDIALSSDPLVTSAALDEGTGVLEIEFSNAIDVTPAGTVDLSGFTIRDFEQSVSLAGATLGTKADSTVISIKLTESQSRSVATMAFPLLAISGSAVTDASGSPIERSPGSVITVNDDAAPEVLSAALDGESGILTITFSDRIDATPASKVYLGGMTASGSGQSVSLAGATLTTKADSAVISIELTGSQSRSVAAMAFPLLAMGYNDVADTGGNPIESSSGSAIRVSPILNASANTLPSINAGPDQTVAEGSAVDLDGGASDADPEDTLTYLWSHNSTLSITLDDNAALDASFTAPNVDSDTAVEFTLTADDGTAQASDTVIITITDGTNTPPTANAGPDQTVAEGSAVDLDGGASDADPEDDLTYSWSHNSALNITFSDPSSLSTSFTAPQVDSDTIVIITLTVSDGNATTSDSVDVTVTDIPVQVPQSDPRGVYHLTLSSTEPGVIEAVWDAPSEAPRDYRISWAKVGESFRTWTDPSGNAFPTGASHTISNLEEGEEYKVQVRARYGGSAGPWSDASTVIVAGTG